MLRKVLLIIILAAAVLSVTGCQTVQGFGHDISWLAGERPSSSRR